MNLLLHNARIIPLEQPEIIESGYIWIRDGIIAEYGEGPAPDVGETPKQDLNNRIVMPGLVDCHTHLMEYATSEVHQTLGKAQGMAGIANLLTALRTGIVALGEHHLGHPVLTQTSAEYHELVRDLPLDIRIACGCCYIGLDPLVLVSGSAPGRVIEKSELTEEAIAMMAEYSDFPGESIFLNATVANLPLSAAPRAGEIPFTGSELARFVEIFHRHGKKIGAHIEGDEAAEMFLAAKGDVIHHGHMLSSAMIKRVAEAGVALVMTPHGGTSSRPTSPEEAYEWHRQGVRMAIASDAYLPVHPEASWIDLPAGSLAGPHDLLTIAQPILRHLLKMGVPLSDVLRLITRNGRELLQQPNAGMIREGAKADLIVANRIPAVETTDPRDILYVIKDGAIVVQRG